MIAAISITTRRTTSTFPGKASTGRSLPRVDLALVGLVVEVQLLVVEVALVEAGLVEVQLHAVAAGLAARVIVGPLSSRRRARS